MRSDWVNICFCIDQSEPSNTSLLDTSSVCPSKCYIHPATTGLAQMKADPFHLDALLSGC